MSGLKKKLESIQRKAKERTVKTQTIEYDLETLVKKIDRKTIQLNPEYQRRHRWSDEVSSRLIESLILNIPVPFIYISQDIDVDEEVEEDVSRYSVIDGQQRLTAIYSFLKNKYSLNGLEVLTELNNSYYRDLPPFLIRRLEERTIRCLRIDSTADSQVKYDIFERLNSGSVTLEPQELRNATCRGPFKKLIKKISKNNNFRELCSLDKEDSKRVQKMEDEELVLRFFSLAYKEGYKQYKGEFKKFLTERMEQFNKLDKEELEKMEDFFLSTFEHIKLSGEKLPFAKYRSVDGELRRMSKFNAAVFDSIVVPVSLSEKKKTLDIKKIRELFHDKTFFSSVEGSVTDVSKLTTRIQKGMEVIS
ncbi:MAG: DUF262 domain-containing protein [Candidatus Electrothrix sp. YB6]